LVHLAPDRRLIDLDAAPPRRRHAELDEVGLELPSDYVRLLRERVTDRNSLPQDDQPLRPEPPLDLDPLRPLLTHRRQRLGVRRRRQPRPEENRHRPAPPLQGNLGEALPPPELPPRCL